MIKALLAGIWKAKENLANNVNEVCIIRSRQNEMTDEAKDKSTPS